MRSRIVTCSAIPVALFLAFVLAGQTQASIQVISSPPSVVGGELEHDEVIWAFFESSSNTGSQSVDFHTTGSEATIGVPSNLNNGTVDAPFDSWFLHFDPVGSPSALVKTSGTIAFDKTVLGVIVLTTSLNNSDPLGASGTAYPTGTSNRGLELTGQDRLTVSVGSDDKTIRVDFFNASNVIDQVRILTTAGAKVIPEPSTFIIWSLLAMVMVGVGWRRRRR